MILRDANQMDKIREESRLRDEEFEAKKAAREAQHAHAINIDEKYNKMIDDLNNDRVKSDAYLEEENSPMPTGEVMKEVAHTEAFNTLIGAKDRLKKARKKAMVREKNRKILSEISGVPVNNKWDEDRANKALTREEMKEYMQRMFSEPMNPVAAKEQESKFYKAK